MNLRNWKSKLAVTASIALVMAAITLVPKQALSQIDLSTRVLNLENFAFGGAKTNTVVPVTNATQILQNGSSSSAPQLTGTGTAVLNYTSGNLNLGGTAKPILAGSIAPDASESNCSAPAFTSCDIIYYTTGTALSKSTSILTAYGAGANIILAYLTTDSSSNILTLTVTGQSGVKVDAIIPGTMSEVPFFSVANVLSGVGGFIFDGTSKIALGVAGTSVGSVALNNATSGSVTLQPPTGALGSAVVTAPSITGSLPIITSCGASLAAAGTCANTTGGGTFHIVTGSALLASNTSTITGISPAFTSSTSWWCVANDVTTRANPVQAIPASGTSLTITNTTGATDLIQFGCFGS